MSSFESTTIREVEPCDFETFYEHQLDPEAIRIAAFVCEDPKDKVAFDAHWNKIGSIRVLQKCGFKILGKNKHFANGRGEDTEEYVLRLDLDQAN